MTDLWQEWDRAYLAFGAEHYLYLMGMNVPTAALSSLGRDPIRLAYWATAASVNCTAVI